jgi:hypothetical protein
MVDNGNGFMEEGGGSRVSGEKVPWWLKRGGARPVVAAAVMRWLEVGDGGGWPGFAVGAGCQVGQAVVHSI